MRGRAPLGTYLRKDHRDWERFTHDQVVAEREKNIRLASSPLAKFVTGRPDRGAQISEIMVDLEGRQLALRVYRPRGDTDKLPLVVSFHGGGFIEGATAQNDWLNSYLAAHCPAVVVGVEYRLAPESTLPAPIDDGYDVLTQIVENADSWGIDPDAVAVMGESAGATIASLVAIRVREAGPSLRAQVLNYPCTDWTETMDSYKSVSENADNPTLSLSRLRTARRLSVPHGFNANSVSPLKYHNLSKLPPALIVTADLDPVRDQGLQYAERLRNDGNNVRQITFRRATHAFLNMSGLVRAARPARRNILTFLCNHLH